MWCLMGAESCGNPHLFIQMNPKTTLNMIFQERAYHHKRQKEVIGFPTLESYYHAICLFKTVITLQNNNLPQQTQMINDTIFTQRLNDIIWQKPPQRPQSLNQHLNVTALLKSFDKYKAKLLHPVSRYSSFLFQQQLLPGNTVNFYSNWHKNEIHRLMDLTLNN